MTMVSYSLECKFVTKDHDKDQNYNRRGGAGMRPLLNYIYSPSTFMHRLFTACATLP